MSAMYTYIYVDMQVVCMNKTWGLIPVAVLLTRCITHWLHKITIAKGINPIVSLMQASCMD